MEVVDPGHKYLLNCLDNPTKLRSLLTFVKREGPKFPGNEGHYAGTNMQEVLRALIDRCQYLNKQEHCPETEAAIDLMKSAIVLFELRAARRHGRTLDHLANDDIVYGPICPHCLHVGCEIGASE